MSEDMKFNNKSVSMDIVVKICITMFTFLVFIFISAWHITKKRYKMLPNIPISSLPTNVKDITDNCYTVSLKRYMKIFKGKRTPVAMKLKDNGQLVYLNDFIWSVNNRSSLIFTIHHSMIPKQQKKFWQGVLFNEDNQSSNILKCLFLKAFETLDWDVLVKSIDNGLLYSELDSKSLSHFITYDLLIGFPVIDDYRLEKKMTFFNRLKQLEIKFHDYYFYGSPNSENDVNLEELLEEIQNTLRQLIETSIFHLDITKSPDNLLCQISMLRQHLYDKNTNKLSGMKIIEFVCGIFEHCFVLEVIVEDLLRGIDVLMNSSVEIVETVRKEVGMCIDESKERQLRIYENDLELEDCLVFTKSVVQEILRLTSPGKQFDVFKIERDIEIDDGYDVLENSILVFNHSSFSDDPGYHILNGVNGQIFRPARFVRYNNSNNRYQFYLNSTMNKFQQYWSVFGVPRSFINRLCLLMLIKSIFKEYTINLVTKYDEKFSKSQYDLIHDLKYSFSWSQ